MSVGHTECSSKAREFSISECAPGKYSDLAVQEPSQVAATSAALRCQMSDVMVCHLLVPAAGQLRVACNTLMMSPSRHKPQVLHTLRQQVGIRNT